VEWYKDDVPVRVDSRVKLLDDGTLSISDIRHSDRADYKCTARNSHGQMSRSTILRVIGMYTTVPKYNMQRVDNTSIGLLRSKQIPDSDK